MADAQLCRPHSEVLDANILWSASGSRNAYGVSETLVKMEKASGCIGT